MGTNYSTRTTKYTNIESTYRNVLSKRKEEKLDRKTFKKTTQLRRSHIFYADKGIYYLIYHLPTHTVEGSELFRRSANLSTNRVRSPFGVFFFLFLRRYRET